MNHILPPYKQVWYHSVWSIAKIQQVKFTLLLIMMTMMVLVHSHQTFFFRINNKLFEKEELQKDLDGGIGNVAKSQMYDAVSFLNKDVKKLIRLCQEHKRPMPTVMKLIYDVQTGNLEADYNYEPVEDAIWELTESWIASLEGK